jgi:germination protein M
MMRLFKTAVLGAALLAMLLAVGCAQNTPGSQDKASSSVKQQAPENKDTGNKKDTSAVGEITIKVYYPNEDGTKLLAVSRKVRTDKDTDKYTAAMKSLLSGTTAKGQVDIIPKAAKLRGIKVENGTARVDFTQELVKSFSGGSTGESMLVGSIVDTLTEFPEVKAVQILVNGKEVETIAGHMDTSVPVKRMDKLIK